MATSAAALISLNSPVICATPTQPSNSPMIHWTQICNTKKLSFHCQLLYDQLLLYPIITSNNSPTVCHTLSTKQPYFHCPMIHWTQICNTKKLSFHCQLLYDQLLLYPIITSNNSPTVCHTLSTKQPYFHCQLPNDRLLLYPMTKISNSPTQLYVTLNTQQPYFLPTLNYLLLLYPIITSNNSPTVCYTEHKAYFHCQLLCLTRLLFIRIGH